MLHLDAIRFFAAMAIVLYHWSEYFISKTGQSLAPHLRYLGFVVDLFFIISGVVLSRVYLNRLSTVKEFGSFFRRRIARLYPLHLLTFLFMAAYGLAVTFLRIPCHFPEAYGLDGVLPNLFLLQSFGIVPHNTFNGPSWSISAEMFCYICLPAILFLYRRNPWIPAILSMCVIGLLTIYCTGLDWTKWSFNRGFLQAIPEFLFGVTLAGSGRWLSRIPFPNYLFGLLSGLFVILGFLGTPRGYVYALVYLIAIAAYAADVQKSSSAFINRVAPLGILTYSIYMLHALFQPVFFGFLFHKVHATPLINDLMILLCFFPMIFVSYISYKYFETPARRWLSGRRSVSATRSVPKTALADTPHIDSEIWDSPSPANLAVSD